MPTWAPPARTLGYLPKSILLKIHYSHHQACRQSDLDPNGSEGATYLVSVATPNFVFLLGKDRRPRGPSPESAAPPHPGHQEPGARARHSPGDEESVVWDPRGPGVPRSGTPGWAPLPRTKDPGGLQETSRPAPRGSGVTGSATPVLEACLKGKKIICVANNRRCVAPCQGRRRYGKHMVSASGLRPTVLSIP